MCHFNRYTSFSFCLYVCLCFYEYTSNVYLSFLCLLFFSHDCVSLPLTILFEFAVCIFFFLFHSLYFVFLSLSFLSCVFVSVLVWASFLMSICQSFCVPFACLDASMTLSFFFSLLRVKLFLSSLPLKTPSLLSLFVLVEENMSEAVVVNSSFSLEQR